MESIPSVTSREEVFRQSGVGCGEIKVGWKQYFKVDETGISTVRKHPESLGPKGQKDVCATISLEREDKVTLLCAVKLPLVTSFHVC
jgi:hypothetical protein